MKELEPILRKRFRCDYCNRLYYSRSACASHEDKCFKNPERNCPMCENKGGDFNYDGRMASICSFCMTASEQGGKSYVPSKDSTPPVEVQEMKGR